jgi:hypothetical protein
MASDRSRPPDPATDAYTGVTYQQGRVTLDRDYNAAREIIDRRDEAITRNVVGPCGTPDNGFAISAPLRLRLPPRILSQPAVSLAPTTLADPYNLLIRSGTMYLGGIRVEWPGDASGTAIEYSYDNQPDWLAPDPPAAPQTEILFLQVDEYEVSATEDPNLFEIALGGPDTTQRLRLQRTVHRQAINASSCAPAWEALIADWQALGWSFDANTMRRLPQARLQASFTTPPGTTDPCDPVATGGYLGAENQLIRVKWVPPAPGASTGTLVWGFDDASFIYRASIDQTGQQLTLLRGPPDAYHFPGAGQYVEVLRTTALLATGASEAAAVAGTVVPRCIAEDTGFVTTLEIAYDPTTSNQTLVLSQPLPPASPPSATVATEPLFVRVWQGGGAMGPTGGTLELVDPVTNSSTGVTVTVTVPSGSAIAPGSFWLMALRPGTPQTVQPASLLAAPQPPDGPRSWACPLAVVEWPTGSNNPVIHDCRVQFENLIELTARPEGCCTTSISPASLTIDNTVQSAINSLNGPGTLCLGPGTYPLLSPLQIGPAQAGLSIVADNGATLMASPGHESAFAEGMIVIAGAGNVTLRGLTLVPPATAVDSSLFNGLQNLSRIALPAQQAGFGALLRITGDQAQNLSTMIGLRVAGSPSLTVEDCTFRFTPPTLSSPPSFGAVLGIGLLAGGACAELAVRGCVFDASAMPATQTPGVWQTTGFPGAGGFTMQSAAPAFLQGAIGCLVSPYMQNFLSAPRLVPQPVTISQPTPIGVLSATTLASSTSSLIQSGIATSAITPVLTGTAAPTAASNIALSSTILSNTLANRSISQPIEASATATELATHPATSAVTQVSAANPALISTQLVTVPQQFTSNLFNISPGAIGITIDPTILATDTADAITTVADLSGAAFEDNVFDSVILAINAMAMLDRLRIEDNTVISSSGGIWLRPLDEPRFTPPAAGEAAAVAGDIMWLKLVTLQQETFLAWLLSLLLPLPTGALAPVFASPNGGTTLQLSGNTIAALAPAGAGLASGLPALAAVSATYTSAVDVGPSLILTGNRLQAITPLNYPAAVVAISGRMSVTSNLISNQPISSPPTSSVSLQIFVNDAPISDARVTVSRMTISDNVLEGTSNLSQLLRADGANLPAPFNTWVPFNASA